MDIFYIKVFFTLLYFRLFKKKTIVINLLAGLGDYIWLRNILKLIKNNSLYEDYKTIVFVTKRWKNFAEDIDKEFVDLFIPIRKPCNPPCILRKILSMFEFDIIFSPYSKFDNADILRNCIAAKNIYDETGTPEPLSNFYDVRSIAIMEKIVPIPKDFKFDLDYKNIKPKKQIKDKYVLLTLGGFCQGSLNTNQVVKIIKTVNEFLNTKVLVLGTRKDIKFYKEVLKELKRQGINEEVVINGVKKFKSSELPYIVDKAEYVISTNTSVWHIAIMLKKKVLCLSLDEKWIYNCPSGTNFVTTRTKLSDINTDEIENAIKDNFCQ